MLEEAARAECHAPSPWARAAILNTARKTVGKTAAVASKCKLRRPRQLLSLFCGAGGLDEGFKQAGFNTQLAFDIDPDCVRTFERNHPDSTAQTKDIGDIDLEYLDDLAGEEFRPVGVLGGPPCQSFSVSNVHQRDDDPRLKLPETYAHLLSQLNNRHPISFFVFENVPGLLGKKHRPRYEKFNKMFQKAGFCLQEHVLNAKHYGVAQERPRIFVVGINEELHPGVEWSPPRQERYTKNVGDLIRGLPAPEHNGKGLNPEEFDVHPNHWCMVPRSKKFKRKGGLKGGQIFGRSFRTLRWDEPSWTVAYGHREVHVHPNGKRRLSIYEAMRLQSFDDDYVLTGHISAQIRLISDAVPPRLAWHIASELRHTLGF